MTAIIGSIVEEPQEFEAPEETACTVYEVRGIRHLTFGFMDREWKYGIPTRDLLQFLELYSSVGTHAIANIQTSDLNKENLLSGGKAEG